MYNLTLWMTKTVDAIWDYFLAIWTEQNGKLHGRDYDKQQAIALEMTQDKVMQIYEASKHYVNDAKSAILHARPLVEQILMWTKVHLDAYLAIAEVILEAQTLALEQGGMRGGGRCHNSVKTGIFKIRFNLSIKLQLEQRSVLAIMTLVVSMNETEVIWVICNHKSDHESIQGKK